MSVSKKHPLRLGTIIIFIIAMVLALMWLFPLVWMVLSAFKPRGTQVGVLSQLLSPYFTIDNFVFVLTTTRILRWMFNSIFVTLSTVAGLLVITSMAAFALSRIPFKYSGLVFMFIMIGLMVPIEATIIPLFLIMVDWGLTNSYQSLILPGLAVPLGVIIQKAFIDGIPDELMEAARIDGAGIFHIWLRIFVPLSRNAMVSYAIFAFVSSWNNFLWPFMSITNIEMMTLPVGVATFQGAHLIDFTIPMAGAAVASAPMVIVFLLFQRQIIKGIALAGIKE